MITNQMPTRHMVHAIIQDTIETELLLRTQTLITQISCLCQEIHDIKRKNKNKSNSTPKAEPREGTMLTGIQGEKTMDSNQCHVRATLPSALNVMNASSVGKLVQLVTASRLILYHEGRIDPMKDECH